MTSYQVWLISSACGDIALTHAEQLLLHLCFIQTHLTSRAISQWRPQCPAHGAGLSPGTSAARPGLSRHPGWAASSLSGRRSGLTEAEEEELASLLLLQGPARLLLAPSLPRRAAAASLFLAPPPLPPPPLPPPLRPPRGMGHEADC